MAVKKQQTVLIVHEVDTKDVAHRKITPRTLVHSGRRSYLIAYCHTDRMAKTFRVNRIRELWLG